MLFLLFQIYPYINECRFFLYKSVAACTLKLNFPLPHVFGLRRLRGNPPRSLWLQHIHRMCRLTRRAHTAVPPLHKFEGTHGVRFAWGNTDAIDFVAIASSLQATNGGRVVGNTNRLKAVSLVHGRKNPHSPVHLYFPSSSTLATVIALRFQFRLQIYTFRL